jgi:hypothetical protein
MPSCPSNSESTYLDGILVASIIVVIVIVEGEINYRSRTGDDLPDGGEVIVVGIGHCCLLLGIGRATGRERPADYRETGRLQRGLEIDGHASNTACSPEKD